MEDRQIREWIRFACERNDAEVLAQVIQVEWNRRFTRRLGDGMYSLVSYRARIRLSVPLWSRASDEDKRETVVHEACHCIVGFKQGYVRRPHGPEWKQAMRNCGVEPLRLHTVDRTGLTRRQRRFALLDCPNRGVGHKCRITVRQFNMLKRGTEFYCKRCGIHVTKSSPVEEDRATKVQKL